MQVRATLIISNNMIISMCQLVAGRLIDMFPDIGVAQTPAIHRKNLWLDLIADTGLVFLDDFGIEGASTIPGCLQINLTFAVFNGLTGFTILPIGNNSSARWLSSSTSRAASVNCLSNGVNTPSLPLMAWPRLISLQNFVEIKFLCHNQFS